VNVTVVVCTYNRCQSLGQALDGVASSVLPDSVVWEILVVDNNSPDQTRAVVEEVSRRYPGRFRYLFEPRQGLSNARNAGIREARGEIVVFTDDDVIVDPLWLQNLTAPMLGSQWGGAGGRISLGQDFQPPRWLAVSGPFDLGGTLVQFDLGDQEGVLEKAPFGANMAFRKTMFEKYGGFRADLDRCGKSLIGNGDTEMGERLIAAGERLWYAPSAVVIHPVQKERLTKKYFRSYWFAYGRSGARQARQPLSIWRVPRHYLGEFRRKLRWMYSVDRRWHFSPQGRFFCEVLVLQAVGQIVESYRQSFHSGRRTNSDEHAETA
jgi:glycosyltransferase involved in cell wall biosynthesis